MERPLKQTPKQPDDSSIHSEETPSKTKGSELLPIKKPRSPYNLFYLIERQLILSEIDPKLSNLGKHSAFLDDALEEPELPVRYRNCGIANPLIVIQREKRSHRRGHGKISFIELCRSVAERWKGSGSEIKDYFRALANADLVRFKKEKAFYTEQSEIVKRKEELEKELKAGNAKHIQEDAIPPSAAQTTSVSAMMQQRHLTAGNATHIQEGAIPPSAAQTTSVSAMMQQSYLHQSKIAKRKQELENNYHYVLKQNGVISPSPAETKACPPTTKFIVPNQNQVVKRDQEELVKSSGVYANAQRENGAPIPSSVQTNLAFSSLTERMFPNLFHIDKKQKIIENLGDGVDSHMHRDIFSKAVQKKTAFQAPLEYNTLTNESQQHSSTSRVFQAETEKETTKAAPFIHQATPLADSSIANGDSNRNLKQKSHEPSDQAKISRTTPLCEQKRGQHVLADMSDRPEYVMLSQNMGFALQQRVAPLLGRFSLPPTIPPQMLPPPTLLSSNLTWEQQLDLYKVYLDALFEHQRKASMPRTA